MPHFARLPVPETDISTTISRGNKLPIRTACHIDRITSVVVAFKDFLSILAEFVCSAVDKDIVVGGLVGDVFARRVCRGSRHGIHVRFGDVFDGDRDVVVPGSEGFVVRGGHEAAVFVNEGDGIDGCEMMVVFLDNITSTDVELYDLLVGHTG